MLEAFRLEHGQATVEDAFIANSKPVSEELLKLSDALWKTKQVSISALQSCPRARLKETDLYVWRGDICTLKVDAIMNAANAAGLGCFTVEHRCIDNVIHRGAGPRLREECREQLQDRGFDLAVGRKPLLTKGYHLPARHVVHVTGPALNAPPTREDVAALFLAYKSTFQLCAENGIGSLALCCLSTGVFRFPANEACSVAIQAAKSFIESNPVGTLKQIIFNVFLESDQRLYHEAFPRLFPVVGNIAAAQRALKKASRVLIVAGAGMSVYESGKKNVYVDAEAFAEHYPNMKAFGFRTGYECMALSISSVKGVPEGVNWGFRIRHMNNMRWKWEPCRGYSMLRELLEGKDVHVLTSNVDGCFNRAGFEHVYRPQGDWSFYQCSVPCARDSFWPSRPLLDALLPQLDADGVLPDNLIPKCPKCGASVQGNVRGNDSFLHSPYQTDQDKLKAWLEEGNVDVVLEIGAGFNTPIITRLPAESVAREHDATFVRINPMHNSIPADLKEAISIAAGWQILEDIAKCDADNLTTVLLPVHAPSAAQKVHWREVFLQIQ